jgi:predicted ATPase
VRTDGLSASPAKREGTGPNSQGVDSFGTATWQHILLALQADAQLAIGKPESALASVAAGLEAVEKTGGAPLEAELYRLKGEALLAGAGTAGEAEAAIEQGIGVARRQNAKSWELRCAMSLARLRRQQGRPQEAAALLAPILGWFTEASTPPICRRPAPSSTTSKTRRHRARPGEIIKGR